MKDWPGKRSAHGWILGIVMHDSQNDVMKGVRPLKSDLVHTRTMVLPFRTIPRLTF
jgi:hypothetical protein